MILMVLYSCKKENAIIRLYIMNNTTDTVICKKYKDNYLYESTIDTNEWKHTGDVVYGAYRPTGLISEKFDSIVFILQNDTIKYSRNSSCNNNPFIDDDSWYFKRTYKDSHHCFSCDFFTVYEYYYYIEDQ